MRFARTAVVSLLASTIAIAASPASPVAAVTNPDADVFISELHYDNAGIDANEAVEVFGPADTDLSGWTLVLYNGNGGSSYGSAPLPTPVPDLGGGSGVVVVELGDFVDGTGGAVDGIQNGPPDGLALVDGGGSVVQFLSYEGPFLANDGPAAGMTATDIGVAETSSTLATESLQLAGEATCYGGLSWTGPTAASFGALGPITPGPSVACGDDDPGGGDLPPVRFNELHYDNTGADVGEAIEVIGPAGTDLTGWTIALYNGSPTQLSVYDTLTLGGVLGDLDGTGTGVVAVDGPTDGIQNGAPDGMALIGPEGGVVEFLSYEGTLTAASGPAAGLTSTDIDVDEPGDTLIGLSLQRDDNGRWRGPVCASFGSLNDPAAPTTCPVDPTSRPLPLVEDFEDCTLSGWEIVSVDADNANTWSCSDQFGNIDVNGFGDAAPANEWLITPPLDLDAQGNDTLTFDSYTRFTDVDYPQLRVVYSTDYDGGGDPTSATWTGLDGITFSPEDSEAWTPSGQVDLSGISGDTVYIAFHYVSSGTGGGAAANWRVDGIEVSEQIPPVETEIYEIQGDGFASPLIGQGVIVDGIVTAVFDGLDGFFIQEAGVGDENQATSDGVFVYAPGNEVSVRDVVTVTGTADEFLGMTQVHEVSNIETTGTGTLPEPIAFELPADDVEREQHEGMYVTMPQSLAISEFFDFGRFGEIVLTTDRQYQPTAVFEPGSPDAEALAVANELNRITLDDGRTAQNPDPAIHPNGEVFTLDNSFRGGDLVTNATGIMNYSFDRYRIQPTTGADYTSVNDRTSAPDVGGDFTVASFNVLNYFTTFGSRGANDQTEFDRQQAKIVAAIEAIDADVVGLIEIENDDESVEDLVDAVNAEMGAGTYEFVPTGPIGTDEIKVAFIYKPGVVTAAGDFAVLDESIDARFDDDRNRPALAQTFSLGVPGAEPVTIVVNHLKSKGSGCGTGDDDPVQGNCNLTRTLAAEALADWTNGDPTATGAEKSLIIGDLNAYDKEDPIDALVTAGYTDLVARFDGEFAYSYVFNGQLGYLDHALADAALLADVTGTAVWHINADEPSLIDYDMTFKQDAQDALYAPDPFRSSDHDPVIVGLDVCENEPPELFVSLSDSVLAPPNHRLVPIDSTVTATDDSGFVNVELVSVTSNEPDDGEDDGNTTGDIVIVDDTEFELRAERSGSGTGRVYTITYEATDGCGNVTTTSAEVIVPLAVGHRG